MQIGDWMRNRVSSARAAHRIFYTIPDKPNLSESESIVHVPKNCTRPKSSSTNTDKDATNNAASPSSIMGYINENIIGYHCVFRGPFGDRKVVYCDWTASGRSLTFIEEFIYTEVLPIYGNTHTTTGINSLQTTMFRHEAREIIRNAVRASDDDAVIFVGSGCTGAIHKLIHNLHLEQPPIVIVGPFEHHSNMLPWRHLALRVSRAETDSSGTVSIKSLESLLKVESLAAQEHGCKLIVCMTAASNVTGILVDVNAFSALIHRYGGLAFWDYATAAPYVSMDMNPVVKGADRNLVYKDAVYFSMHKFIGGPQTPGVLIAKRSLFDAGESQPCGCGGGTVFFVRRDQQLYLKDVEEREEGGTPAIVESIRAGIVMHLKQTVTPEAIMAREDALVKRLWARLSDCPNIIVLGGSRAPRLPIFSIVIRHTYPVPRTSKGTPGEIYYPCLFLHHNFVASLLNDLFGVQARSGCACAGPYAMDLLGIDEALAKLYEDALVGCPLGKLGHAGTNEYSHREVMRPGFTRLSLPYFMPDDEVDFVLESVKFVATHGWVFLPHYKYNAATAEWIHRNHDQGRDRKWLNTIGYTEAGMMWSSGRPVRDLPPPRDFRQCMDWAYEELCKAATEIISSERLPVPDDTACFTDETKELRWFLLPSEAAAQLRNETSKLSVSSPESAPWHPGTLSACFCPDLSTPKLNRCTSIPPNSPGFPDTSRHSSGGCLDNSLVRLQSTMDFPIPQILLSLSMGNSQREQIPVNVLGQSCPRSRSASDCTRLTTDASTSRQVHKEVMSAFVTQPGVVKQETVRGTQTPTQPPTISIQTSHKRRHRRERKTDSDGSSCKQCPLNKNNHAAATAAEAPETELPQVCPIGNKPEKALVKNSPKPPKIKPRKVCLTDSLWCIPPKTIFKRVAQAIRQFDMIQPGDRVLVCLSGGKDSLTLLHCLHRYQYVMEKMNRNNKSQDGDKETSSFSLGAVTIDPGTSSYDPRPLIPYLEELGVPYFYEKQGIIDQARNLPYEVSSICSFCSRMKRGRIYACARQNGYNVIALGQHLDDVAESFLMSCFHNGTLLTMKANYWVRQRDLRVIRPLVFVRESQTRLFASEAKLPVIPENCPACFSMPKERHRIKRMLAEQELLFPRLFPNLLASMMPLIREDSTRTQKKSSKLTSMQLLQSIIPNQGQENTPPELPDEEIE